MLTVTSRSWHVSTLPAVAQDPNSHWGTDGTFNLYTRNEMDAALNFCFSIAAGELGGALLGTVRGFAWLDKLANGGKTFYQYKIARGGTETLKFINTSSGVQRISTEFHHVFISQALQRRYNIPNWMVNNRLNVWKLNTIQHSLIDSYRYNFLRSGIKPEVGWFNTYNWFTNF